MEEARHGLAKGYVIEGYRIDRVLGAGGFGITYLATELAIERPVAIKEYLPNGIAARSRDDVSVQPLTSADNENFRWGLERFKREAQTLVAFQHPNIVSVYRFFEANGTAYLVMGYEDGDSLASILDKRKTLPEAELRALLKPLLSGLDHVHKAGFLHRDIKPGNIYIRRDGSPVLLDFGAARLAVGARSQSLTSIVSAGYAPFEQYTTRGNQGPWTDIYALGGVLYRAVTGQRPPDAPDRIRNDPYVPAARAAKGKYSAGLLAAIDTALIVDEEQRPQHLAQWRPVFDGGPWPPAADDGTLVADRPVSRAASSRATQVAAGTLVVGARPEAATRGEHEDTRWPTARAPERQTAAPPVARERSTAMPRRRGGMAKWIIIGGLAFAGMAAAATAVVVFVPGLFGPDQATREQRARAEIQKAEAALARGDVEAAKRHLSEAESLAPDLAEVKAFKSRLAVYNPETTAALRRARAALDEARAAIKRGDFAAAERAIAEAARLVREHTLAPLEAELAAVRRDLANAKRDSTSTDSSMPGSWPADAELRRAVDATIQKLLSSVR